LGGPWATRPGPAGGGGGKGAAAAGGGGRHPRCSCLQRPHPPPPARRGEAAGCNDGDTGGAARGQTQKGGGPHADARLAPRQARPRRSGECPRTDPGRAPLWGSHRHGHDRERAPRRGPPHRQGEKGTRSGRTAAVTPTVGAVDGGGSRKGAKGQAVRTGEGGSSRLEGGGGCRGQGRTQRSSTAAGPRWNGWRPAPSRWSFAAEMRGRGDVPPGRAAVASQFCTSWGILIPLQLLGSRKPLQCCLRTRSLSPQFTLHPSLDAA